MTNLNNIPTNKPQESLTHEQKIDALLDCLTLNFGDLDSNINVDWDDEVKQAFQGLLDDQDFEKLLDFIKKTSFDPNLIYSFLYQNRDGFKYESTVSKVANSVSSRIAKEFNLFADEINKLKLIFLKLLTLLGITHLIKISFKMIIDYLKVCLYGDFINDQNQPWAPGKKLTEKEKELIEKLIKAKKAGNISIEDKTKLVEAISKELKNNSQEE